MRLVLLCVLSEMWKPVSTPLGSALSGFPLLLSRIPSVQTLISTSTISIATISINLKTIFQFYFVKDFRHIKRPHFTLLF